jgi:hypothetical protein
MPSVRAGSQDTARGVSLLVLSEITDPPTLAFRSSDKDLPYTVPMKLLKLSMH